MLHTLAGSTEQWDRGRRAQAEGSAQTKQCTREGLVFHRTLFQDRGLIISLFLPSFAPRLLSPCTFEALTLEVPCGLCPLKPDFFLAPTGKSRPNASSRPDSATHPGLRHTPRRG